MKSFFYILTLSLFIAYSGSASAMYKCIDKKGTIQFTDTRISSSCSSMNLGTEVKARITGKVSFGTGMIRPAITRRAGKFEKFISYYGVRYNVDPHLIRAVIRTESGFNPRAVSKKGAQGLMQLMPGTAKFLKVADPFDPQQNIEGGTRYLRTLLNTFKGDKKLALAAYNAGPTRVKKLMGIPRIPETVNYVKLVMKYYDEYRGKRA